MHAKANEIVLAAHTFIDVPYRHQGRSKNGIDCAGLVICTAKLVGISSFDTSSYSRRPNADEFTKQMIKAGCTQLPVSELAHGDILRIRTSGWPVHLGIYEIDERGDQWYIHAYLPYRKVARDPLTPEVWREVSSVWRFPE